MKKILISVFVVVFLFNSGIVLAKPGKGKGPKDKAKFEQKKVQEKQKGKWGGDKVGPPAKHGPAVRHSKYFSEQTRTFVHHYYADQFRKGRCPPGRKHYSGPEYPMSSREDEDEAPVYYNSVEV